MIKKYKAQNYQYALIKIDQCQILFKASKDFVDSVFTRHFSQRLIGDVNG
jgi:hypothetical protein